MSEIKQTMTTKVDDLNHTLTPKIDGLTIKIKDLLKAQAVRVHICGNPSMFIARMNRL